MSDDFADPVHMPGDASPSGAAPADEFEHPLHMAPAPETHTSAPGLAASAARGLAPYATGALAGGAVGSIVPGIGTAAGAAAGAGAVALTDLAGSAARALGITHMPTVQEGTDKVMDWLGIRRPTTGIERMAETTAAGVGGAVSGAGAAREIANAATSPVVKGVATQMAAKPVLQAASGATSGAASQGAAEAGAPGWAQTAAGFLGSLVPFAPAGAARIARVDPKPAAVAAIDHGYVLPPAEATEGSIGSASVPNMAAGFSGKVKMRQYASAKNQPVTNQLAAADLGLPPNTALTPQAFENVRKQAGQAYADLPRILPSVTNDPQFIADVTGIGSQAKAAAQHFPNTIKVDAVNDVIDDMLRSSTRPTSAMVEAVKRLRFDAKANLQARADPDKLVLGLAQRRAAQAIDDLLERQLANTGDPAAIQRYRDARTLIAKSYDVESVTNASTNDVDARHLGGLFDKGKPLTGNLKIIADSANHFPHAFQPEARIGGVETFSVLDMAYAAAAAAAAAARGDMGFAAALAAGVPFLRPAVRAGVLSKPFQRNMVAPSQPMGLPYSVLQSLGGQPNAAQDLNVQ